MKTAIKTFITEYKDNDALIRDLQEKYTDKFNMKIKEEIIFEIDTIQNKWREIHTGMSKIENILDNAIHGHMNAKRQIERIIGQWISGEQKGYCFGAL